MNRCLIGDGPHWFDRDRAEEILDVETSLGHGRTLYRTATGKYVVAHWSRWEGEHTTYHLLSPGEAAILCLDQGVALPPDLEATIQKYEV